MLIHYNLSIAYSMCFIYEYNMSFSHFRKKELVLCFQERNTRRIFACKGLRAQQKLQNLGKTPSNRVFSMRTESTKSSLYKELLTYFTRSDSRKGVRCLLINTFPDLSSDTRPAMLLVLFSYTQHQTTLQLVNSNNNVG